jgi:transposase-like protein
MGIGLLLGKTTTLYTNLLEELYKSGPFSPQSVMCDFEQAIHNAVEAVWPSTAVRGCFLHYKQAMNRKLQQHNRMEECRVPDSDVRRYFQMMGSIAFFSRRRKMKKR